MYRFMDSISLPIILDAVIPKPRAFSSGARNLACAILN
jgi:hypothetical protein